MLPLTREQAKPAYNSDSDVQDSRVKAIGYARAWLSNANLMEALILIPDWQQIHPLVIHFPTALLIVAPIFILIGILRPPELAPPFLMCALLLMVLGTFASYVAVWTGLAAESQTNLTPPISEILKNHRSLAETTRLTFSALTIVFVAIVLGPRLAARRLNRILTTALPAVFLVLYAAGAVLLVNTAYLGGRLVHEFGVTATHQQRSDRDLIFTGHSDRLNFATSDGEKVQTLRQEYDQTRTNQRRR